MHEIASSDLMYRVLVQGVREYAIYLMDAEGRVLNWNPGAQRAKGYTADEIVGRNFRYFYSEADREAGLPSRNLQFAREKGSLTTEGWRLRKDGTRFWASVVIDSIYDETGLFVGFAKITRDLTEQRASQQRLKHLASHDPLTDLLNRSGFDEALEDQLPQIIYGAGLAVHYIDLDRFKSVNDAFGHKDGDALLRQVAERLRVVVGASGIVSRRGGDEFAVLQHSASCQATVAKMAGDIVSALNKPFMLTGGMATIGASVGIALAPQDGTSATELLQAADLALYEAKSSGRGRFNFYAEVLSDRATTRRVMELRLRHATATNGFCLFFQPIVEAQTNRVAAYEALIRWRDPQNRFIPPDQFIPVAEELGMMPEIGAWVLREACRHAATWSEDIAVAVNISATQLRSATFVDTVGDALKQFGLAPERLELELTETSILADPQEAAQILRMLRSIGVKIALDDFGTGFSSLSLVQKLPLTRLKIDKSFVHRLNGSPQSTAMIRAISLLCEGYGLALTAEGVETEAQRLALLKEGCSSLQGYLFGKPAPLIYGDRAQTLRSGS